jgi:hypothetical protein
MLIKVSYQVPADNGPLVFPVNRSLLQIFPGSNNVDTNVWEEIKKLPRTQELLQQRLLYSPDYTAIVQPPVSNPNEKRYELVDASEKSREKAVSPPEVDAKPARVASKTKPVEETLPDAKTQETQKTSKFKSGISSPDS